MKGQWRKHVQVWGVLPFTFELFNLRHWLQTRNMSGNQRGHTPPEITQNLAKLDQAIARQENRRICPDRIAQLNKLRAAREELKT